MPVSLSDKPNDDKPAAATPVEKAEAQQQADVDKVNKTDGTILAAAAASGDAAVHDLLGQRVIAEQNQDTDELKRIDKEIKDHVS
jgi:hypothetical protein